jgi:hypothetical protein
MVNRVVCFSAPIQYLPRPAVTAEAIGNPSYEKSENDLY